MNNQQMSTLPINNKAKSKNCYCGTFWTQPYSYATQQGAKMMATKCYRQEVASGKLLTKIVADENNRWHIAMAPMNGGCSECGKVQQAIVELHNINFQLEGLIALPTTRSNDEAISNAYGELRKVIVYMNENYNGDWK